MNAGNECSKSRVLGNQERGRLMASKPIDGPPAPVRIARIGPTKRREALECLLGSDRYRAERFMRFAHKTEMNLDHLWSALDEKGRIRSTVLASPNPGRTAMVFVSPPEPGPGVQLAAQVIQHALKGLGDAGICLAQALVTPEEVREMKALEAGGLHKIAILTYMQFTTGRRDRKIAELPDDFRFGHFHSTDRGMIEQLLAHTYIDTLDCPGLVGLRCMEDIVDGHMKSGTFKPEWWTILYQGDHPVGASLVNESRDASSAELVYLGIIPELRGRGLGRSLLTQSIAKVAESTMKTVVLAVDEANAPALEMYRSSGFRRTIRRHAFVSKVERTACDN
ncbi:MAG: hypothetical protein CBC35_11305 [Planctomycetes bacterium TMED75]|nr:hypothetical protein [Planctomycetaceae bacterium]OUU90681.1 MAG: hypothetical protein CBC35_11305 [Planctomycetes bacterium TMED75]